MAKVDGLKLPIAALDRLTIAKIIALRLHP
jgi:hypothetical protein